MKIYSVLYLGILLVFSSQATATQIHNPDFVAISAKYAKLKAKQRAQTAENKENSDQVVNLLPDSEPGSCDLNIGNVIVDDVGNSPDDVVIIIEGDILQANNCR